MYTWFLLIFIVSFAAGATGFIIHPGLKIKLMFLFLIFCSIVLLLVTGGYFQGIDAARFYSLVIFIVALSRLLAGLFALKSSGVDKP